MTDDAEVAATVCALANYLRANPHACDAPEGIRRWWLPPPPVAMETLLMALAWMKDLGLVEETVAADGRLRLRCIATDEALQALNGGGEIARH
jgi:hypothetical protein